MYRKKSLRTFREGQSGLTFMRLTNRETSTILRSSGPTKEPIPKEQDTIRLCWTPAC